MKKQTVRSNSSERMTVSSLPGASWRNSQGEEVQQLTAKNQYDRKYLRGCEIDFKRFPVAVLESDDWGCCSGHLETPADLEKLYRVLESIHGADGRPVIVTAFTCMGNPDFEAIRKNKFTRYEDIAIDKGFPKPWSGKGTVRKYLDGIKRGVWRAEYHALLHHVSPRVWLQWLVGTGSASDTARERFERQYFAQPSHLPEYQGFTVAEQNAIIQEGFERFRRTFGYQPRAAVTSDAYPETVVLWAANGIDTVPLVNCRCNDGTVTVYQTKPWNFQDMYAKMGDIGASTNAVYLARNAFFEGAAAAETFTAVDRVWNRVIEPAVISCHRCELVKPERLAEFAVLLKKLADAGAVFLTTAELSDLYRQGWTERAGVLCKYAATACPFKSGIDLATGKKVKITEKSLGNFKIKE
ncbi:MAG: hypothetical protein IJS14_13185 [Lentisphaeria bacterium]|nr:hypothetical protein [Lentisphaeria bacterium]